MLPVHVLIGADVSRLFPLSDGGVDQSADGVHNRVCLFQPRAETNGAVRVALNVLDRIRLILIRATSWYELCLPERDTLITDQPSKLAWSPTS